MKSIFRSYYWILSFTIWMLLNLSCKKEKIITFEPPAEIILNGATATNIGQWGFRVNYSIDSVVKTSGIIFSSDSATLSNSLGEQVTGLVATGNLYTATVDLIAFPATSNIFYKIYTQNANGYRRYTKIYSHNLASMLVQNPFIVKGPAASNTHSPYNYWDYDEGLYGELDHSLSVMCALSDVSLENYKAYLNGISLHLDTIILGGKNEIRHRMIFDVPEEMFLGKADLKLYHKNNLVTSTEVEVCSGGLLTKNKRVLTQEIKGNYASYSGEIYNYACDNINNGTAYLYKWKPTTNEWTKLTNPVANVLTTDGNGMQVLNGIIYFMPHRVYQSTIWNINNSEEYMITYDIANAKWDKKILYSGKVQRIELQVHDSFIYQEKIYWIAKEKRNGWAYNEDLMMCYDPASGTYSQFHILLGEYYQPFSYKATVLDGKVYLLRSGVRSYTGSSYTMANKFYEFDMSSKTLIPKSWVVDKTQRQWIVGNGVAGFIDPYLVSFKGKIYAYGGILEREYFIRHHTLFAVYDSQTDKWSPVNNSSFYTAKVSQTDGFMLPVGDQLYLGHGFDGYSVVWSSNSPQQERSPFIYTVSVK